MRRKAACCCLDLIATKRIVGRVTALLPNVAVLHDLESEHLVDILPEWRPKPWIVHAVFPSHRGLLPYVRLLLDHLAEG